MAIHGNSVSNKVAPISSSADVYRSLVNEGLMLRKDGSGRDDALWGALVEQLSLPKGTTNLPEALETNHISVEDFVRAFFCCFEPFTIMMADICLLMEKHDAKKSYHSMSISYNFSDEDDAVVFSLKHFREYWRSYQRLIERAIVRIWQKGDILRLSKDLEKHREAYPSNRAVYYPYEYPKWSPGKPIPDEWSVDDEVFRFAQLLSGIWDLITSIEGAVNEDIAPFSTSLLVNREQRMNYQNNQDKSTDINRLLMRQEVVLYPLNSDELTEIKAILSEAHHSLMWIFNVRKIDTIPSFDNEYRWNEANRLDVILNHYSDLPTEERIRISIVEELHSILNLPVWKHRWQLYQVWVGMFILNTFQDKGVQLLIHTQDDKIELYEHHPAQIADINGCRNQISFWAELQTAISEPIGKTRSIRPDYRLTRSPVTNPASTIFLAEVKQRLSMSKADMEGLLSRYRLGCPNSFILFVNYDSFPDYEVPDKNVAFISQFRPGQPKAIYNVQNFIEGLCTSIIDEQKVIAEELEKSRVTGEQCELNRLIELAREAVSGISFVKGFHSKHESEHLGAIVLDYRNPDKCIFNNGNNNTRDTVIQLLRANPLAQVWLAGTNMPPKLAYNFDYDRDRNKTFLLEKECDLEQLVNDLRKSVAGRIKIIGYSSAMSYRLYNMDGVLIHGYSE